MGGGTVGRLSLSLNVQVGGLSDGKHVTVSEREQAVKSWSRAQCRGGGKCQQRTPPTLSALRACGVSLVDVVSAGVGEGKRERQKQLEE